MRMPWPPPQCTPRQSKAARRREEGRKQSGIEGEEGSSTVAKWARWERWWSRRSLVQPTVLRISRDSVSLPTNLIGCFKHSLILPTYSSVYYGQLAPETVRQERWPETESLHKPERPAIWSQWYRKTSISSFYRDSGPVGSATRRPMLWHTGVRPHPWASVEGPRPLGVGPGRHAQSTRSTSVGAESRAARTGETIGTHHRPS